MMNPSLPRVPVSWKVRESRTGLPRIPFLQRCRLEDSGGVREGMICDLSAMGVFVSVHPVPAADDSLEISFQLPGGDPVVVDGVVMWQNVPEQPRVQDLPPGCGVRFLGLSPHQREKIQALVKAYTAATPRGEA